MRVSAGRKHQLRKACARVLQAPIIGDGLYGQTRSAQQLWFNDRFDQQPGQPGDRPEEALSRMLRCNRYLQLHCIQVALVNLPNALPPCESIPVTAAWNCNAMLCIAMACLAESGPGDHLL